MGFIILFVVEVRFVVVLKCSVFLYDIGIDYGYGNYLVVLFFVVMEFVFGLIVDGVCFSGLGIVSKCFVG